MTKYAQRLTKEDLIRAGIKDIYYDPAEAKYHIVCKNDKEIKLHRNKQRYFSFNVYDLDAEGNKIKKPIKRKFKGCRKETNTYIYKFKTITLHRAAFAWIKGEVPEGYIVDHLDNKHETHYDNRLDNLQLLTPEENLAKERPNSNKGEMYCLMTKPVEYYLEIYNYWLLEYEREKRERSSATEYAHKCRCFYNNYRKKIRYWYNHKAEWEEYNKLETAKVKALQYQQERASKKKQFQQEIKQAKEISKELWRQKVKEYNTFLENHPFMRQEELEKMFLEEVIQ